MKLSGDGLGEDGGEVAGTDKPELTQDQSEVVCQMRTAPASVDRGRCRVRFGNGGWR